MASASVGLTDHLQVGLQTIFQVEPCRQNSPRYKTRVRGWQNGTYVILDRPKADESEYIPVQSLQQECVVRFLTNGIAVGFRTTVLDTGFSRLHPQVSIAWPSDIISLPARGVERVTVDQPCLLAFASGDSLPAVLHDLSASGCQLLTACAVPLGTDYRITCQLSELHQIERCEAEVLGVDLRGDRHLVRCRFTQDAGEAKGVIGAFLQSRQAVEAA